MIKLKVDIRQACEEDISILEQQMNFGYLDKHKNRIERQKNGEVIYLIAWYKELPVGHVLIKWGGSEDEPIASNQKECPDLEDLLVKPEYRSHGVGRQLILYAQSLAKEKGYNKIGLGVGLDNPRAHTFYLNVGFEDCGFGEFTVGGSYIDSNGIKQSWEETCIYLVLTLN